MSDLTKPDQPDLNPTPSPSDSSNSHWPPEATNGFVDEGAQPSEREVEGAVPPGYDWPTHGGYLGCLVATIAACLLTGFIGANLFSFLYIVRRWPFPLFALLTLVLFVGLLVGLGRLGWELGKRFYRYYPQVRPTWGESDAATVEGVEQGTVEEEAAPAPSPAHGGAPDARDREDLDDEQPAASQEPAAQVPSSPQGEGDR